jgi:DNA-directed RNA polymerase subunit RPC12/RpoP
MAVDEFYRCQECGGPYFKQEDRLVLKIEDPKLHLEDFRRMEAPIRERVIQYVCEKCGAVLDRAGIAEKTREELTVSKVKRNKLPDENFEQLAQLDKNSEGSK